MYSRSCMNRIRAMESFVNGCAEIPCSSDSDESRELLYTIVVEGETGRIRYEIPENSRRP